MAVRSLSALSPGSIIKIPETTGLVDYRVLHQNYNATQNGSGRVLIGRNEPFTVSRSTYAVNNTIPWSSKDSNAAYVYCNQTYPTNIDPDFLDKIPETQYCASTSIDNATSGIVSSKFFLPSANELNVTREEGASPYYTIISDAGQSTGILSQASWILSFASNEENDYSTPIFTRTGHKNTEGNPYRCGWGSIRYYKDGGFYYSAITRLPWTTINSLIALPMFTLEGSLWQVNDDGTIYQGPLPPSGFVNFPLIAMQQNTVQISWDESNGATSYTLQRSTNNGSSWETAYTGPNTSYTDTVGAWDTVMYQVSASNADGSSPYTQSASIPVVASSTLVISGQDGELGTLTGDVSFQVLSNTGNQIDLSVAINGFTFYTAQVDSGYNHKISIYDIPTGSGQIVASASVQSSAGVVNQTRTWQYIKQSLQFVDDAGMSVLEQNGENIYPLTVQEAVKTYSFWGNTLDKAMMQLANATFYSESQRPIYSEYHLDMSTVQVGDIVQLPENGIMQQFLVCSTNYEPTLNTSGNRVLLTRCNFDSASVVLYENGQTQWSNSNILTYLNSTYLNKFDEDVKTAIGTTNYLVGVTPQGNQGTISSFASAVFLLGVSEINVGNRNVEGFVNQDGTLLTNAAQIWNQYRIGNPYSASLRSFSRTRRFLMKFETSTVEYPISSDARVNTQGIIYPCFTLPTTFSKTYYVDINNQVHDAQEYVEGGTLTNIFNTPLAFTKYASGTYVGTGTSGSSNPMSLTFPTKPLFVMINGTADAQTSYVGIFNCNSLTNSFSNYKILGFASNGVNTTSITGMLNGTSLSWYGTNASYQLNTSGTTYAWTAFLE